MGRMRRRPPEPGLVDDLGNVSIVGGSLDGGLSTIEQPAAMAGDDLVRRRLSGKLKGLIAATGPIGKRRVMPMRPLETAIEVERDGLAGHAAPPPRHRAGT